MGSGQWQFGPDWSAFSGPPWLTLPWCFDHKRAGPRTSWQVFRGLYLSMADPVGAARRETDRNAVERGSVPSGKGS